MILREELSSPVGACMTGTSETSEAEQLGYGRSYSSTHICKMRPLFRGETIGCDQGFVFRCRSFQ